MALVIMDMTKTARPAIRPISHTSNLTNKITNAMKKTLIASLLSLTLCIAGNAAPFMAIGDGAEVFLTGSLGVRVDDNIFLEGNATDDIILDVNPGLDLTFGKGAQVQGSLTLVHAFATYTDNSDLNTNLFSGSFRSRYEDGKTKSSLNVSFSELNQNTPDIRGLTRRDVFNAGADAEVAISELTSIGAGVTFDRQNYKRASYSDRETLTVPVDLFYEVTPKIDMSIGYRYRDYKVDIGSDSTDHYLNVGARGEFTPKLSGRVTVGFNRRNLDVGNDRTGFGLDANLNYAMTPKTSLQFGAGNDYDTSPQGQQQENLSANARITSKLADDWTVTAGLNFRQTDYPTRTDDYWEGTLGATYVVNAYVSIVGAYVYRNYASPAPGADFKNNVFSIAANLRY